MVIELDRRDFDKKAENHAKHCVSLKSKITSEDSEKGFTDIMIDHYRVASLYSIKNPMQFKLFEISISMNETNKKDLKKDLKKLISIADRWTAIIEEDETIEQIEKIKSHNI